ncbi:MAG: tetratricopeptide repeat protein [Asticcacaulis sp.]|uniref:tetratricopeptide repeat protein n=1 Tax=Asticcacaulis sp. TaxID=1872648 RepID=UPI003F7BD9E1
MTRGLTSLALAWLLAPAAALPALALADPPPKAPPTPQEQLADLNAKAASGDAQATYDLAQVYVDGMYGQKKNDQTAAQWVAKAADLGLAEAQADYAHRLETGKGVKADTAAALTWWLKAADQGQAKAVLRACERLTQGPDADWTKAFSYCDTAANAGAATALYARGVALTQGLGTAADPASGLKDLDAAGDKDNSAALEALGVIYADGKLVAQDYKQALSYFRRAAARGDRDAVLHMAQQIETGQGTEADPEEAARLYDVLLRANPKDGDAVQAKAWFDAHPKVRRDAFADNILKVSDVARDTIFYAVDNDDPRFQTLDMAGYFDYLSQNSYPGEAQNDGVSGMAAAECRFAASGDFYDCVLMQDAPPGYGFGSALMSIFDRLGQSGNKTDWAKRYAGKVLRLSMRWKIN